MKKLVKVSWTRFGDVVSRQGVVQDTESEGRVTESVFTRSALCDTEPEVLALMEKYGASEIVLSL